MGKRVILIVADSFGIGEMPDAEKYGDKGSNTLKAVSESRFFRCPFLRELGLFNIDGTENLKIKGVGYPRGSYARLTEKSAGKDTITGHWELSGIITEHPFPVYPNGFPKEITERFERETGRGILCNKPYSGTEVIKDYGKEQIETGKVIVYTSADSVFQIAAHTSSVSEEELYKICRTARKILTGDHAVARVIARPFEGDYPYKRTSGRHDFSLEPQGQTMLDAIKENGLKVISVGKIYDIFSGRGITDKYFTESNADGLRITENIIRNNDFNGLLFVNLVDFDMKYGHRNDVDGYAKALTEFDAGLKRISEIMKDDDILIVTADHGCDPSTPSTDHSREYVPLLIYGKNVEPAVNYGTRKTFADVASTVSHYLNVNYLSPGNSLF